VKPTHLCIDCAALPLAERPKKPRPAPHGGPRSKRCVSHWRVFRTGQKFRAHATYVTKTYGLSAEEQAELWAFQGERCPCGRRPTRMPDTDHDHTCCSGPTSCGRCVRGLTCRACNKDVLGRYNSTQLRALALYLEDPPMTRLRRSRQSEVA